MFKNILAAVLTVAGVMAAGEVQAAPRVAVRVGPLGMSVGRPYYATHGRAYHRGGYYYAGRHHNHWSHRVWNARYRRYHYYDPYLRAYYYYNPTLAGYYPVPMVPVAPPVIPTLPGGPVPYGW